jgi:hypothetical protein
MQTRRPLPIASQETLTPEEVGLLKRTECRHYEICLRDAVRNSWPQFHCNECTVYAALEVDLTALPKSEPAYYSVVM